VPEQDLYPQIAQIHADFFPDNQYTNNYLFFYLQIPSTNPLKHLFNESKEDGVVKIGD